MNRRVESLQNEVEKLKQLVIPLTVKMIKHIKKTYHCPHCHQGIKAAKLPPQPIPGNIASPGTIASIVAGKYVNVIPLYRQAQELKRLDIPISVSTQARWMIKAGTLIQPLINLLGERPLIYDMVCMDETPCQVLKDPGKTPQSQSFMWVRPGGPPEEPIILFDYSPMRSRQVPVDLLDEYSGYLQVDAYKVQAKLKRNKTSLALQAIKIIKALYTVEDETDVREFNAQQRQVLRQAKSKPILKKFKKWLDKHLPVVGRKAWLFCDTVQGAKASANLYSLVETDKANGLEPYAYLKRILTELPKATCVKDIEALLPFKPAVKLGHAA